MIIGVVGKGGVGKTTVAALLARAYAAAGRRVVAVDTDSNPNLGLSLGLSLAEVDAAPDLPRSALVRPDAEGIDAAGLLAGYGRRTPAGVTLLTALRVDRAGAGCTCGGHATVRSLLGEALDEHADVTIVDMEAGIEHLSRAGGTLAHADVLVCVVEPSRKSVVTAARTRALAEELGLRRIVALGNKARDDADVAFLTEACAAEGIPPVGVLPFAGSVAEADRAGTSVTEVPAGIQTTMEDVVGQLDRQLAVR